jgi:ATP-dependent Clp protease ATP-binding subunit ClpA
MALFSKKQSILRVLQRAVFHVRSRGKKQVGVVDVLVALFSEKQSYAVELLDRQRVTRLAVVVYISRILPETGIAGAAAEHRR